MIRSTGNLTIDIPIGQSRQLLPVDSNRRFLAIKNLGAGVVTIAFDQEAGPSSYQLQANEVITFQNPESCPQSYVKAYAIAAASVAFIAVTGGDDVRAA